MFTNAAAGKFQIAESGNTPQQAEPQAPLPSWVEGDVDNQSGTSRDPRIIGQALRESFLEPVHQIYQKITADDLLPMLDALALYRKAPALV
jgi:hypothetical protein